MARLKVVGSTGEATHCRAGCAIRPPKAQRCDGTYPAYRRPYGLGTPHKIDRPVCWGTNPHTQASEKLGTVSGISDRRHYAQLTPQGPATANA